MEKAAFATFGLWEFNVRFSFTLLLDTKVV